MPRKKLDINPVFHALGDPTRRAMLERLTQGRLSVSALAGPLGTSLAGVVQQLQILEESGLVTTEKLGRVRTCQLNPAGFEVAAKWIGDRRTVWERRLDRLADVIGVGDHE